MGQSAENQAVRIDQPSGDRGRHELFASARVVWICDAAVGAEECSHLLAGPGKAFAKRSRADLENGSGFIPTQLEHLAQDVGKPVRAIEADQHPPGTASFTSLTRALRAGSV